MPVLPQKIQPGKERIISNNHFKALAFLLWCVLGTMLIMAIYTHMRLDGIEKLILEGLSL